MSKIWGENIDNDLRNVWELLEKRVAGEPILKYLEAVILCNLCKKKYKLRGRGMEAS